MLTINGGSSSLKFALFRPGAVPARLAGGQIERIGLPGAFLTAAGGAGEPGRRQPVAAPDHAACLPHVMAVVGERAPVEAVRAVGHRVVHGGPRHGAPAVVTPAVLEELRGWAPVDPEHLPAEIALMEALAVSHPGLPQAACFDTAFHHDLPPVARLLPIPRRYLDRGIRRYGFHGLSYGFLLKALGRLRGPDAAAGRVILAHLGNGASLAAVRGGRPVDTSMAFTPTAGLPMSTRSGDLDPGLVLYLARSEGMTPEAFHRMVNAESGLLGVSGTGSDVRDLLAREATDARAAEALALFCYQARKWVGAFAAALGGLDTLVFSGGIGERAPAIRARICQDLGFLGIVLDPALNEAGAAVISAEGSPATVCVIHTDEEAEIAHAVCATLGLGGR